MFRTRDFVLIFTAIVFLVAAISVTTFKKDFVSDPAPETLKLVDGEDGDHLASVETGPTLSRDERLQAMRNKIAEGKELQLSAVVETEDEPVDLVNEEIKDEVVVMGGEKKCSGYKVFQGEWSFSKLEFDVVEGSRIVFEEVLSEAPVTASTTTTQAREIKRDVYLQLPIRIAAMPNTSCLTSDVIGVAKDGSLIRNNEAGLYGVFGADTLVGYALDGFPIYGVSNTKTDTCGGTVVNGQYQYLLSKERQTVLNCFSAPPVNI